MQPENSAGGLARNRTGVQGFAVLCVTTPPRGHPRAGLKRFQQTAQVVHGSLSVKFAPQAPQLDNCLLRNPPCGQLHANIGMGVWLRRGDGKSQKSSQKPYSTLGKPYQGLYRHSVVNDTFPGSSVVEQLTVNQLVAGSNPARGATNRSHTRANASRRWWLATIWHAQSSWTAFVLICRFLVAPTPNQVFFDKSF